MVRDRNCDVLAVANIGDGCDLGICEREQQAAARAKRDGREAVDDSCVFGVSVGLGWDRDGDGGG